MRLVRKLGVLLSLIVLATLVGTQPAFADRRSQWCPAYGDDGNDYYAYNRVYIISWSSTLWRLDYTEYNFLPSNNQSVHNNQNIEFFGGSGYYSEPSADSLVRDNQWHVGMDLYQDYVYGQKNKSYATFEDIIDIPSTSDPHCYATTATF